MEVRERSMLQRWWKYSDILVALAVILMVVMMVIPLPAAILDLLLTLNLATALVVLLVTMYILEPLGFSVFPSLLLVTTLFRLALNVSSTRLILLNGYAGEVIQSFGRFVVGGNPVVGFVVFCILVIIQFVVITRGAERVAEVAARFTLDAMPGKQMSIDADLNAGLITEAEARARRREIEREADFYGAMDGASKFVKGDAIAGIFITIVNLLGGFVIGVVQRGLSAGQAVQTYALLTVGDGLVSQIPALLISTAAGIMVTRAASESNLGQDVTRQLLSQPRVLAITAGVLGLFGLVPGLPHFPFFLLSALMGGVAYSLHGLQEKAAREERERKKQEELEAVKKPENVASLLQVDPLEIELGYGLLPLADAGQGGDLLERVVMIRRQCALEMGLLVPPIRVRDNMQLKPNHYVIKLRGAEVGRGEIMLDHYLAMNPGTADHPLEGIETREPAFGLTALWITARERPKAELYGYTVVDPPSVVATHLTEVIKSNAHVLLGRQEVQTMLDSIKQSHPALVEELVPEVLNLGEIQKVLQNLLREGISIRDLVTCLETMADYGRVTRDPEILTEYVRQALARSITRQYLGEKDKLPAITLDPELEREIGQAVERAPSGSYLALEPARAQEIVRALAGQAERAAMRGVQPVILCSPAVRPHVKKLIGRVVPRLPVLSYPELEAGVAVETVGMVRV